MNVATVSRCRGIRLVLALSVAPLFGAPMTSAGDRCSIIPKPQTPSVQQGRDEKTYYNGYMNGYDPNAVGQEDWCVYSTRTVDESGEILNDGPHEAEKNYNAVVSRTKAMHPALTVAVEDYEVSQVRHDGHAGVTQICFTILYR